MSILTKRGGIVLSSRANLLTMMTFSSTIQQSHSIMGPAYAKTVHLGCSTQPTKIRRRDQSRSVNRITWQVQGEKAIPTCSNGNLAAQVGILTDGSLAANGYPILSVRACQIASQNRASEIMTCTWQSEKLDTRCRSIDGCCGSSRSAGFWS